MNRDITGAATINGQKPPSENGVGQPSDSRADPRSVAAWVLSRVPRRETWSSLSRLDRAGLLLLAAFMVWAVTTTLLNRRPVQPLSPYLVSPVIAVLGVVVGRRLVRADPGPVAVGLVGIVAYVTLDVVVRGGPAGGPLGYANSNAALIVQLMALTGLMAVNARGGRRRLLLAGTLLAVVALVATECRAAMIVSVPLLAAIWVAVARGVRRRWWPVTLGAVAVVGSAAAVILGAGSRSWLPIATYGLSPARHVLWRDALTLWSHNPVIGSGLGSFRRFSALAENPDLAMAHCSILQIGAETGLIGVGLFAAILAVGFALVTQSSSTVTLLATAAWTAVAVHSFVDHMLEFPAVVLAAGAVTGWASGHNSIDSADPSAGLREHRGYRARPVP